ncbi:MAG: type II secretion system F family protein [Mycobacteriales bacterium]
MTVPFLLLAAALVALPRPDPARRRYRRLYPTPPRAHPNRRRLLFATAAGLATAVVLGWPLGIAGVPAALVAYRFLGRSSPPAPPVRDLPFALDLLAAALRAGQPPHHAAGQVGAALPGPVGEVLARIARAGELGADPATAWVPLTALAGAAPGVRAVRRAGDSGTALATAFTRLAAELRADHHTRDEEYARRAGIVATLPLGLCFLPAFLAMAVVPVLFALAAHAMP